MNQTYPIEIIENLNQLTAEEWDLMNSDKHPFLSHAFLAGLESKACVCEKTGWFPQHLVMYADNSQSTLVAAMPCYLKEHSYGEYIFDWSWADAYHRAGINYYPKLSCAVPFTPATTPKWLIHPEYQHLSESISAQLITFLKQHAQACRVSSIHALFTEKNANTQFNQQGFITRSSTQFHWHNRHHQANQIPYSDFDDYLQSMSSRKRKNIKRERLRVADQGVRFQWWTGADLDERIGKQIFEFYLSTIYRYGAQQYLSEAFFQHFVKTIPQMTHVLIAYIDDSPVAGGLFFSNNSTLYGRYWGAHADIKDLHFETCYYQPIEYAISKQLLSFEAGAQGEHKLSRGLLPMTTYSQHWLADKRFHAAIIDFTQAEAEHIQRYKSALSQHGPFKTPTGDTATEI